MKHIILIITLLLMLPSTLLAQEKQWNMIKNDASYIWGEGLGSTEEEADKNALSDLISKINVKVVSESKQRFAQIKDKNDMDEASQFTQSVETYSKQTLNNTVQYRMGKAPEFRVGRAIKREEITNMFKARAQRASEMVMSALKSERKGRIDDAMRNLYWALTLLKSLQYPNDVKYTDPDGNSYIMTNWIKEKMEDICDEVKLTCVNRDGDDVDVDVTYKGKPVSSIGFTFFDGRQWSPIVTASDGYGKLEFVPGYSPSDYQVRLEYQYRNEAKTDKELEEVMEVVTVSEFKRSLKTVKGMKKAKPVEAVAAAPRETWTSTHQRILKAPTEVGDKTPYHSAVSILENAIRTKAHDNSIRSLFTPEGWDIYVRLIRYGQAKLVGTPNYRFYENGEYVTARGLQLSFSFQNGVKKSFVEEVVFTFDRDFKICNVSFSLGKTAEDDILNKGVWNQEARIAIMNFLENYKTAYALKRYDYIESIFDDNAIIIIGNVVKKQNLGTDRSKQSLGGDIVKFNRYSKDQYLANLKKCFNSQEFINIHFSNNDIIKANKEGAGEVYGIQLEQDYYSATYGDHGYLFLYVDLNDQKNPLIKIRTWQPEKDSRLGPSGIYSIADF